MQYEYLLFNIMVISGPLIFGSFKRFYFMNRWKEAFVSAVVVSLPYLLWDVFVTGSHWEFNPLYITGVRIAGLPVEEILFFITVPVACIFTWEMLKKYSKNRYLPNAKILYHLTYILPVIAVWLFIQMQLYTGLVLLSLALAVYVDRLSKTALILSSRFYGYLLLVFIFTFVFNGYLTWRPVVLYGEMYYSGIRLFTIPVEDFGYGTSLIMFATIFYEKYSKKLFRKLET